MLYDREMRMWFDPTETDEYEAAKTLLVRRVAAWANTGRADLDVDEWLIDIALDFRHQHSIDGRLAFWTPELIDRFMLRLIPRQVSAPVAELEAVPDSLRALLGYLAANNLLDVRGATLQENLEALAAATPEYRASIADPSRYGAAKRVALAAMEQGAAVGALEPSGDLHIFEQIAQDMRPEELLESMFGNADNGSEERMPPQLPIELPTDNDLDAQAAESELVLQLQGLWEWVGSDGRALTKTGVLRIQDARELSARLGIDGPPGNMHSSADLYDLSLILEWAKKARIVRANKGRLVQVAKAARLVERPGLLWTRAFETTTKIQDAICRPTLVNSYPSMLRDVFDVVVPDVLNAVYSLPEPMPVIRLQIPVWQTAAERFMVDDDSPGLWRLEVERDFRCLLHALELLGAVRLNEGMASDVFIVIPGEDMWTPEEAAQINEELAKPGLLVQLTPLGTRAVRQQLLAAGRDAPMVGELVHAGAADMLNVLVDHYSIEAGQAEIRGWLAANGGDRDALLDAVRHTPFRTRAAAMLQTLRRSLPDPNLMVRLRSDPVLGVLALSDLVEEEVLSPSDMSLADSMLAMTEGILRFLEVGGPEAVMEALGQQPADGLRAMLDDVLASGHPDEVGLAEFRTLVAEPLLETIAVVRHLPSRAHGRPRRRPPRRPRRH